MLFPFRQGFVETIPTDDLPQYQKLLVDLRVLGFELGGTSPNDLQEVADQSNVFIGFDSLAYTVVKPAGEGGLRWEPGRGSGADGACFGVGVLGAGFRHVIEC